jgi:hypothetical protein
MFNPNASSIENAITLFAVVAPGLGLLYLAVYFAAHVSRRRRQRRGAEPGRSLLDVLGRQAA